jgi:hypothetical protein
MKEQIANLISVNLKKPVDQEIRQVLWEGTHSVFVTVRKQVLEKIEMQTIVNTGELIHVAMCEYRWNQLVLK